MIFLISDSDCVYIFSSRILYFSDCTKPFNVWGLILKLLIYNYCIIFEVFILQKLINEPDHNIFWLWYYNTSFGNKYQPADSHSYFSRIRDDLQCSGRHTVIFLSVPRGAVWSRSTLFAIPSASFGCITLRKHHLRVITTNFLSVRIFRKFTVYFSYGLFANLVRSIATNYHD